MSTVLSERRSRSQVGIGLVACLVVGCDSGDATPGGLAGPDRPLAWSVEPVYELGGASAPDWAAFGGVVGVAFDDEARLYILDADARRITVVDPDGNLARTIGGPGDGPGELSAPSGLAVDADGAVTVFDQGRQTFVNYAPGGLPLDSRGLDPGVAGPDGPLALDPLGRVIGTHDDRVADAAQTGPRVLLAHARSTEPETAALFSGWLPPTPEVRELTEDETGGMRVRMAPIVGFHPPLLAAVLPDGVLAVVDSVDYRIRLYAPTQTGPTTLRRPIAPVRVTQALRDEERRRRLAALDADPPRMMLSTASGERSLVANEGVLRLERARLDAMGFHEVVPVITRLAGDRGGRLWVQRSDAAGRASGPIDILRADGSYVGTLAPDEVEFPDAFGPGGRVAYLSTDPLGAPVVHVGRLRGVED